MPYFRAAIGGGGGGQTATGSVTVSTSDVTVNLGFRPKYFAFKQGTSYMGYYDESLSTTQWVRAASNGLGNSNLGSYGLDLYSDGVIFKGGQASSLRGTVNYFAIG